MASPKQKQPANSATPLANLLAALDQDRREFMNLATLLSPQAETAARRDKLHAVLTRFAGKGAFGKARPDSPFAALKGVDPTLALILTAGYLAISDALKREPKKGTLAKRLKRALAAKQLPPASLDALQDFVAQTRDARKRVPGFAARLDAAAADLKSLQPQLAALGELLSHGPADPEAPAAKKPCLCTLNGQIVRCWDCVMYVVVVIVVIILAA